MENLIFFYKYFDSIFSLKYDPLILVDYLRFQIFRKQLSEDRLTQVEQRRILKLLYDWDFESDFPEVWCINEKFISSGGINSSTGSESWSSHNYANWTTFLEQIRILLCEQFQDVGALEIGINKEFSSIDGYSNYLRKAHKALMRLQGCAVLVGDCNELIGQSSFIRLGASRLQHIFLGLNGEGDEAVNRELASTVNALITRQKMSHIGITFYDTSTFFCSSESLSF